MFFVFTRRRLILSAFLLFSLGIVIALFIRGLEIEETFNKTEKQLPIYSVEREDKVISISFDCAWGIDYTDKLLSIMQEEDIRCTFFTVEFWAKKHPDYIEKIDSLGHEIGTHSSTHPKMSSLSSEQIDIELTSSMNTITNITGKKVELFRPPFGDYNNTLLDIAKNKGLYTIQWSVDSLDWKDLSSAEICSRVVGKVKNGSIVLFHNQGKHTAEALPLIIKQLKSKGYTFVPIGELIYRENFYINSQGAQVKIS